MTRKLLLLAITFMGVLASSQAFAARTDLTPYLQSEVNEIAMLTAQANYLQAQGDPLGAAVVASYVPDHQMMVNMLSKQFTTMGGNPATVVANIQPFLGTREAIINKDLDLHHLAILGYQRLAKDTDPALARLALLGLNGASRHFSSLEIARAATVSSPSNDRSGLMAALMLERTAIADLQIQSARLTQLGDMVNANKLTALIPQHQSQATALEAQVRTAGGNPAIVVPAPVVALDTSDQILMSQRTFNTQLVNSYAIAIAFLPATDPLHQVAFMGQPIALVALNNLVGFTTPTVTPTAAG